MKAITVTWFVFLLQNNFSFFFASFLSNYIYIYIGAVFTCEESPISDIHSVLCSQAAYSYKGERKRLQNPLLK